MGQQQLWVMLVPEQPRSRSPAPRSHPASPVHAHTQVCKPKHHCVHAHAGGFPALHPGTICAHAHARRRVCNTWAPSCVRGHTRVPPREPRCGLGTPLCSVQACAGVFAPRVLAPSLVLAAGAAKVGAGVSWRHVSKLSQQHRCGCAGGGGRHLGVSASSQHGHPLPGRLRSPMGLGRFSIFLGSTADLPVSC